MIGNAIFKAANLPSFRTNYSIPFTAGISGGALAAATCVPLIFPFCIISTRLEDRYKGRYRLSGRVAPNSLRNDGHFPVLLLWIPLVYLICVLTGVYAYSLSGAHTHPSRAHLTQMGATAGLIVAPLCTLGIPLFVAGVEIIYDLNEEVMQGHPNKLEPALIAYLGRQAEAFVWLFTTHKPAQVFQAADSSDVPPSIVIGV